MIRAVCIALGVLAVAPLAYAYFIWITEMWPSIRPR